MPAGVLGLLLGWFLLPRTRLFAPSSRFDSAGLLLMMPCVAALLFAFSQAGPLLTVLPVALGLVAPVAGLIADRWGARIPTTAGMVLTCLGLLVLVFAPPTIPLVVVALAAAGLGLGLFTPANNATVAGSGFDHQAGMVSGVLNMTRGIGTSLGVAVAGAAYALASGASGAQVATPSGATTGLQAATVLLAILALIAAGLSAAKGRPRTARAG